MHVIAYRYPLFDACIVTLAPNEQYTFSKKANSISWGLFGLSGYNDMLNGVERSIGRRFGIEGQWNANDENNGWSNDVIGYEDGTVLAGPDGSKWLCLSSNGNGDMKVQHQKVDGSYTLTAGISFIVATGSILADGKTAIQANYFKPRLYDVDVTGTADLLLLS
jgi:hypothetical protein